MLALTTRAYTYTVSKAARARAGRCAQYVYVLGMFWGGCNPRTPPPRIRPCGDHIQRGFACTPRAQVQLIALARASWRFLPYSMLFIGQRKIIILGSVRHNYIRSKLSQLLHPCRALFLYRSALLPCECRGESSCSFSTSAIDGARDRTPFQSAAFFADVPNKSSNCRPSRLRALRGTVSCHTISINASLGGFAFLEERRGWHHYFDVQKCGHCPGIITSPKSYE